MVHCEYIWHVVLVFLVLWLWNCKMADGVLYCLNLNSAMHFRVDSRGLVTFKTKLYVTTVNNNFPPLTIFYHKELYLRCCIVRELTIVTWSAKTLKNIGGTTFRPHDWVQTWEIWKSHPLKSPKNTFL